MALKKKKKAIQESRRHRGGIYETWRKRGKKAARPDVQFELNEQCKSLISITDKGQGEQSYDSEL